MLDLEQRLLWICDLGFVNLQEVVQHLNWLATLLTLVEGVGGWAHVPTDSVDLVSPLLAIVSHYDRAIKITINGLLALKSVIALVYNC